MTVHNALVGAGLRDRVRIGASGKVATGIDIVKRLVQGADYTNAARAMMMAVGCIQAQRCHTNTCPVGVATQDPRRARALDVAGQDRARRAATRRPPSRRRCRSWPRWASHDPRELRPHHAACAASTTHDPRSYAELYDWLAPGRAARRAARRAGPPTGRAPTPTRFRRLTRGAPMTTVAELIVDALADHGRAHRLGRRRRRPEPGHRRDPPRGPHRVDRRAPRGGRRVRRLRAGAAHRHARRVHGHGRARARSTCSTASTTPRSRTRRCWRICGQVPLRRDRQRLLPGGRQRRAVRRRRGVPPTRSPAPSRCRGCSSRPSTRARASRGVAVLTLPGDVGGLDAAQGHAAAALRRRAAPPVAADADAVARGRRAAQRRRARSRCSSGMGAREARDEVLALAERLAAPMVLTLKAKEGLEHDNPFAGRPDRADRQPGRAPRRSTARDVLLMLGTDFPYRDWYPDGQDRRPARRARRAHRPPHAGRRRALVGDAGAGAAGAARRCVDAEDGPRATSTTARERYADVARAAAARSPTRRTTATAASGAAARASSTTPTTRIRPEALAAAVDRHAAADAIFTTDTGHVDGLAVALRRR